jgi:hypothetical protein
MRFRSSAGFVFTFCHSCLFRISCIIPHNVKVFYFFFLAPPNSKLYALTMKNEETTTSQLDALFHSRSIAIVGLPREMKSGSIFLVGLKDQGFQGKIYPVHPIADEIQGIKAYPSVSAIPGPADLAIVLVPRLPVSCFRGERKRFSNVRIERRTA